MENYNDIKILSIQNEKTLIDEAYKILQDNLGKSYINFDKYCFYVKNNQTLVSINKNEVVGTLIFELTTEKSFFDKYNIKNNFDKCKILNIQTLAVKYHSSGIGTELIDYCIAHYSRLVEKIYAPLWKSINGINASRLFQKFGFNPIITIDNYWYKDSIGKKNYCPVCNSPCTCSIIIYYKAVKSNNNLCLYKG